MVRPMAVEEALRHPRSPEQIKRPGAVRGVTDPHAIKLYKVPV